MANSFADFLREQFEQQAESARQDGLPAQESGSDALARLDRERQAYRAQLQAQSELRFRLGQMLRVLAWRLIQLAGWVSP